MSEVPVQDAGAPPPIQADSRRGALRLLLSLRFRTLIAAFALVLVLSLVTGLNSSRLLLQGAVTKAESDVRQTAGLLNIVAAPYAVSGTLSTLHDFLAELLPDAAKVGSTDTDLLVYVVIVADDGQRLLAVGGVPEPLPGADANLRGALSRGIVHVRSSILLRENRVGFLQFGMSTRQTLRVLSAMRRESVLISSAIGMLALAGTLVAGWSLARRIRRLTEASQLIADGQFETVRADQGGVDEIAELGRNFNRMADAVRRHIREVRSAQEETKALNDSLESAVADRTRELAEKNVQLAETVERLRLAQADLIQSEKLAGLGSVVAGVAHELNTPIGNAVLLSTTLVDKIRRIDTQAAHSFERSDLEAFLREFLSGADMLNRNLQRAAELVRGFKQVAVDQTSQQRRRFHLREIVDECLLLLQPHLRNTRHRIQVDIDPSIRLDSYPGPLGQIVTNLVNNSLLHAFSGKDSGYIGIQAVITENDAVQLTFRDDGVGVPPENLKHIFDPFFTTRLGQGGSGLGLYVTYNVATQVLGGTIEVQSLVGSGTTFVLVLPRTAPQQDVRMP